MMTAEMLCFGVLFCDTQTELLCISLPSPQLPLEKLLLLLCGVVKGWETQKLQVLRKHACHLDSLKYTKQQSVSVMWRFTCIALETTSILLLYITVYFHKMLPQKISTTNGCLI